ncbi:MAG: PAS domain S-box protein, partial [Planctomycetota bacterium]
MTEHEPTYEELLERCRRAEGMLAAIRSGQVDTVLGDSQTLVVRLGDAERRLQERIKELDCLYGLSRLVESGASLPAILQGMANLIPVSWRYPEAARARILLDGVEYRSHADCGQACEDCSFDHQRRTIRVDGADAGEVCVSYAEPRPSADEGPFLSEERALLNAIAERLGHVVERHRLGERMERARRIVEDSPTVLFRWGAAPDWPVEYVSENVKRFGYAPEDFLSGRVPYASIVHPDDLERVSSEVRRHAESGEAEFGQEYRIRAQDGTIHWVDDRTSVDRNAAGEIVAFEGMVLDITDRKRADAALRDSEARFRALAEHMPVLVNAITEAGTFTFWNRACEEVTGYGKDEMVGNPDGMARLYPDPAHRERLAEEWQAAGGVFRDKEITLQAKDGSERTVVWTNLSSSFSFTERDTWAIGVDITERKRAEEAVQQAKARLEATLESIGDGFFSLDGDLVVTYFNAAAERLLGRPRDEVVGRPLFDAFPEARGSVFEENYRRALREKERQSFEVNFAVAPYQNWYEVHVYPQEDGISVYFQVVTGRKQAEAALRRSEENHRTTLNSIGDAVIATDVDGRIREMNPVAETLTGWPLAEAVGRPLEEAFQIVNAQTRETVQNPVSKVLATGRVVGLANHTLLISRDGTERQIADSAAPIRNDDDMTSGVVLVFRDVTEEYAAAEALRDSEAELRRAQAVAQVGSWRFNLDTGAVTASDEARRIYGIDSRDWTIEEVQTVPLPEYRDRLDRALRDVVERGKPYDQEFRIRRPSDGAVRDIHSIAAYDAARNRVIGTIQDVTDRKTTERALRESEEHLRSIFRAAPVGIGVVVSRVLRQVNEEVCEMTGYTQDELVGESARMLYPSQQEYDFVGREKYAQIRSRGTGTVETRWLRKDGRIIDVLLSSTPMDLEDLGKGVTFTALDITERKRTETALRQSEALLEATGRMARVGGWELDAETLQVTWTRETYRIHEVPPGEKPLLEDALSFWHPEDRPLLEEAIRRALEEKEPYDLELRFITARGRELYARAMCTPIVEDGRVVKLRGTFQDITERKRAEEELETIFEMSLALICVADIETATFTRINPAFRTVLGYEEDELLSRSFLDFVHPDDVEPTRQVVEENLRQGREVFSFENRYRCKDGSYRWLTWNSHPRPDQGVTYAVAVDVTESKEAEQALRESEARYRVLMEQTGDAMLVHDLDANLIDVNDFACTTYGYTRDELLQMNIRDLDPDYAVREDGGAFWEGLELYKPILFEVRQRKQSGDIFPAEVRLSLIKYHGATVVLGFCRDISERKLAEQALR